MPRSGFTTGLDTVGEPKLARELAYSQGISARCRKVGSPTASRTDGAPEGGIDVAKVVAGGVGAALSKGVAELPAPAAALALRPRPYSRFAVEGEA